MHYYQSWLTIPNSPGGIIGLELSNALTNLFAFQGATLILLTFFSDWYHAVYRIILAFFDG
jgi:hypothetical protein